MRVEVNLSQEVIAEIDQKAKKQNNSRKAYIEKLCINNANMKFMIGDRVLVRELGGNQLPIVGATILAFNDNGNYLVELDALPGANINKRDAITWCSPTQLSSPSDIFLSINNITS